MPKRLLLCICALYCLLAVAGTASAKTAKDVDAYTNRDYDFAAVKSLFVWPVSGGVLPESVSLSLPTKMTEWTERALQSQKMKFDFFLKPTKSVWQGVELLYGTGGFKEPFESKESAEYLSSHLDGACAAVLKTEAAVSTERKWHEPYTRTYTTTERVRSTEKRYKSDGTYEFVEVYTYIPVTKVENMPGYWYISVSVSCRVKFIDTKKPDAAPAAEARVSRSDVCNPSDERLVVEKMTERMIIDCIAALFYK